jgi:hypothetical protein
MELLTEYIDIIAHVVGFMGMACVVFCFWALERGVYTSHDKRYYIINLTGAILLTLSLLIHFNLGAFIIEMFWIWISVSGLLRKKKSNENT